MKVVYLIVALLGFAVIALLAVRMRDGRADRSEWERLSRFQVSNPTIYDPSMVSDLPEPAERFFNYAISPGTPLFTVAEIDMGGQFSLGSREDPNYRPMAATQILAAPEGFVWKLRIPGLVPISGSDSAQWTRFRILGFVPVARAGGDADHRRSAFGRYVAEALFWTPAALLPGPGIVWSQVDENTARVSVSHNDLFQEVDVTLDDTGRPTEVHLMRWSNANPENTPRLQPFGGTLSDFRQVQGFRLPFYVEAGNMYGTDEYFPFFKAKVSSISFRPRQS